MSDKKRVSCPTCGRRGEQLISGGAGLVFKGSGFYITDYKRAGEKKEKKTDASEKAAKSDTPAKSDQPAESKPATSQSKPDRPKSDK